MCSFLDEREPVSRVLERRDDMVLALSTVPLSDGATLAVFTDITAAKSAERALRERNEALEQAAELRGNFVSNVSYHLRDPLQSIIGFAQLLTGNSMTPSEEQQREYASYILSSSTSLMTIVNDILDLASIQANVLELDITEVDVSDAIHGAVEALKDRIAKRDISLVIDVAPMARHLEGDAPAHPPDGLQPRGQRRRLFQPRRQDRHRRLRRGRPGGDPRQRRRQGHPGALPLARLRQLRDPRPGHQAPRAGPWGCR